MLIDRANRITVADTVAQYEALLRIQKETGTLTKRTRSVLLQNLDEADLVAVSMELVRRGLIGGTK